MAELAVAVVVVPVAFVFVRVLAVVPVVLEPLYDGGPKADFAQVAHLTMQLEDLSEQLAARQESKTNIFWFFQKLPSKNSHTDQNKGGSPAP